MLSETKVHGQGVFTLDLLLKFADRHKLRLSRARLPEGKPYGFLSFTSAKEAVTDFISCLFYKRVPIVSPSPFSPSELEYIEEEIYKYSVGKELVGAFTSGSTSPSNFHLFSLESLFQNALWHSQSLNINAEHTVFQTLPLSHLFGIVAFILVPALTSCDVKFSTAPLDWTYLSLETEGPKIIHLIPELLKIVETMESRRKDFILTVGAGRAPKTLLDSLVCSSWNVFVTYGLTEAGPRVSTGKWHPDNPEGWVGKPFPQIKIKLSTLNDTDSKSLWIKTSTSSLNVKKDNEGFLETKDLAEVDAQDNLIIKGRRAMSLKWRGRLFTSTDVDYIKEKLQVKNKAVLVVKENKLALYIGKSEDWLGVFDTLQLPSPTIVNGWSGNQDGMGKTSLASIREELNLLNPLDEVFVI